MTVQITYGPAYGKVLSGSYTLSNGISPSIIQLETMPLEDTYLPPVSDITFSDVDSGGVYTLFDCRLVDVSARRSESGITWTLQFEDARWKWGYGAISGEYNLEGAPKHRPLVGTEEYKTTKDAWALAGILQAEMGGMFALDRAALPDDDYPPAKWDFANPAEALAELAERYGLIICYDPLEPRVLIRKKGEGEDLPDDIPFLTRDMAQVNLGKPEKLIGVCEKIAYEWEFDLEAVGIDTDGVVRLLADLSYKPAGGWGAGVAEGSFDDISDEDDKKDAERSVYRYYRVKPKAILTGDSARWTPAPSLKEMLPLQRELLTTTVQTDFTGAKSMVHRPAYVYGTFVNLDKKLANKANVTTAQKVPVNFSLDAARGLVKFSSPVYKYDGSGNVVEATLKLRCVVHGRRHTVEKSVGGGYGSLFVPCRGLTVEEIIPDLFCLTTPVYGGNIAEVEREVNKILDAKAESFEQNTAASASYIGIHDIKVDGKIEQVTWEIGPNGATTKASLNTEHAFHVPSSAERRQLERAREKIASDEAREAAETAGLAEPYLHPSLVRDPRFIRIYNASGETIPAFGLVEVTGSSASGFCAVTKPTDDYLSVGKVLVNGEQPIAAGCYGLAQASDIFMFLASGSPAVGDEFGTTSGSFSGQVSATEGTGGILVCGITTGVSGVALARFF